VEHTLEAEARVKLPQSQRSSTSSPQSVAVVE